MREDEALFYLEHPTSKKHPRMSRMARAAQFAPFSALVGLEEELAQKCRSINGENDKQNNEGEMSYEDA